MRRLGWVGVEIECDGEPLVIDYSHDISPLVPLHSPNEPFPLSSRPGTTAVTLLTHLHTDPGALIVALRDGAHAPPGIGDRE